MPTLDAEIERFHGLLQALSGDFGDDALRSGISDEQFLQGPLSDAMTHAGQLALLRRLHGEPVPSENFILATISRENVTREQPHPARPDSDWSRDRPPRSVRPEH